MWKGEDHFRNAYESKATSNLRTLRNNFADLHCRVRCGSRLITHLLVLFVSVALFNGCGGGSTNNEENGGSELSVMGLLGVDSSDGFASAMFVVADQGTPIDDALVMVNDTEINLDVDMPHVYWRGDLPVTFGDAVTLSVSTAIGEKEFSAVIPSALNITHPEEFEIIHPGEDVHVEWDLCQGTQIYQLILYTEDDVDPEYFTQLSSGVTSHVIPGYIIQSMLVTWGQTTPIALRLEALSGEGVVPPIDGRDWFDPEGDGFYALSRDYKMLSIE